MTNITDNTVKIQTTSESNTSTPAWFGEVVLISRYLQKHDILSKINEHVRFARKRFGRYEIIDFLAVQIALRHQWRTDPGRTFTSGSSPLRVRSWRYLIVISSPLAQPF